MTTNSTLDLTYRVLQQAGFVEVREDLPSGHKSLFATQAFSRDSVLCRFSAGETLSKPTRLTIQTGLNQHITLEPDFLQYLNHSCRPDTFFDTTRMVVISLEDIGPGDELTFFYPSTEWDMAEPFACYCGQATCLGHIKGAVHLTSEVLSSYRLTDFIAQQLAQRGSRRR